MDKGTSYSKLLVRRFIDG